MNQLVFVIGAGVAGDVAVVANSFITVNFRELL